MFSPDDVSRRLRELRERKGLSLRALAQKSGVAVSFLSKIESGRGSPTVITLVRVLEALDTSAPEFFAAPTTDSGDVLVFRHSDMQVMDDGDRFWRYLFPHHPDIKAVLTYEEYSPRTKRVEPEWHPHDICGLVLSGVLTLEATDKQPVTVGPGDSFYIRAETRHTVANRGAELLRLVATELPHTRAMPLLRRRPGQP
ncbi:helix-turn-helix domain-containing protein [bacterium]|nr:helix-turn-helix domain-containing protein [bacterium]